MELGVADTGVLVHWSTVQHQEAAPKNHQREMQADIWSMQATVTAVIVETIAIDIVFLCLVKKTKRRRIWWSELLADCSVGGKYSTLRLCDTHREFHDMSANYGNKYYAVSQRQETENRLASTIGRWSKTRRKICHELLKHRKSAGRS